MRRRTQVEIVGDVVLMLALLCVVVGVYWQLDVVWAIGMGSAVAFLIGWGLVILFDRASERQARSGTPARDPRYLPTSVRRNDSLGIHESTLCLHKSPRTYDHSAWSVCTRQKGHDGLHEDSDSEWKDGFMPSRKGTYAR